MDAEMENDEVTDENATLKEMLDESLLTIRRLTIQNQRMQSIIREFVGA